MLPVSSDDVDFFAYSQNIFNKDTSVSGKYVNCVNGNYGNNASYHATGFVKIVPGTAYTLSSFDQLAFYDEDQVFIGGMVVSAQGAISSFGSLSNIDIWAEYTVFEAPLKFVAQTGFSYINASIGADKYNEFMIWKGDDYPSDYIPYYRKIPYLMIDAEDLLTQPKDISRVFANIVKEEKTIKLIGDSITAGVGGTGYDASSTGGGEQIYGDVYQNVTGHCWANSLKAYWESKFDDVTVINNGWSGIDTHHIIDYWNNLIDADDDIIICSIGTNDRAARDNIAEYITNLETIVKKAKAAQKQLVLVANIPASVSNENISDYNFHMEDVEHAVRYVTDKYNIPFLNIYSLFIDYCESRNITIDSLLDSGGLHPNDDGYDVMFKLITNAFGISAKRPGANW